MRKIVAFLLGGALVVVAQSAPPPAIPVCPGLTVVTAVAQQDGDYESIKTIEAVDSNQVKLKYSAEGPNTDLLSAGPAIKKTLVHRIILTADLDSAKIYEQTFLERSAETIPGTTAIGASSAVLRALKSKGESEFSYSNAYAGVELTADRSKSPNYYSYLTAGVIKRVPGPARIPVLVNEKLVDLPAIRAEGEFLGDKVEFFFLDDEKNPLTLMFRIGIGAVKPLIPEQVKFCEVLAKGRGRGGPATMNIGGGRCDMPNGGDRDILRVIKITDRCTSPAQMSEGPASGGGGSLPGGGAVGGASAIEKALADTGKADIYSIYFSYNNDQIREESEPTLKEIADVLNRHPAWKLSVNGHTDGIGSDTFNLDLSKRRAASVRDALVKKYAIDTGRLSTAGFGKSQPKDTNDTLEGRAHNRRVELIRQ